MASDPERDPVGEALCWHLRLRDGTAADWQSFVAWLEADPAHAQAYDRVETADAALDADVFDHAATAAPVVASNDEPAPARLRGRWPLGVAAAVAVLAAVWSGTYLVSPRQDLYEVASAPGEQRRVDLGEGSFAALNGGTRLVLDRNEPRRVELLAGEATFTVRHDADRPFAVVSGSHRVEDLGTVFNVVSDRGQFSVEVVEGRVIYDPDASAVQLAAGQGLRSAGNGRAIVFPIDPKAVAGWQRGQLSYVDAPLSRVAGDLARSLGVAIMVDDAVAAQPFTGTIRVEQDAAATIGNLALAAGVRARHGTDGWVIEPTARAPR